MSPTINLFIAPGSCSLAPHILLHESGLPFTTTSMNFPDGFPSEWLLLNPKRRVPFLQLDNTIITENPAIMTAISQLAPDKKLLGKTNLDAVRCYEWMNWLSGSLHGQAYGAFLRPRRFVDDEILFDTVKSKGKETIRECYEFIEGKMEGRKWAVGEDFTAVDAYFFVFWRWGNAGGFEMREKYPNYTRLVEEVSKREAVVETVKKEAIEMFGV